MYVPNGIMKDLHAFNGVDYFLFSSIVDCCFSFYPLYVSFPHIYKIFRNSVNFYIFCYLLCHLKTERGGTLSIKFLKKKYKS